MPQKQSSNTVKAIRLLAFAAVIGAASAISTLFFQKKMGFELAGNLDARREAPGAPSPSAPIFMGLEPFTATIPGEYKNHVLYVAISLRLENQESASTIDLYMPEVRDRTLNLLSQQDGQTIQTPAGRAELAKRLRYALALPYAPDPRGPDISDVHFTAFVVQ